MVAGTRAHAEALREEVAAVLAPMGLRLSAAKTRISHIDEGFDFLGFRIQRHPKRGTAKRYVYTYPSKKALAAVKAKVRALTRRDHEPTACGPAAPAQPGAAGLDHLLPARGVQGDLQLPAQPIAWRRVICWLRHKHPRATWKQLRRRYLPGWWPTEGRVRACQPRRGAGHPVPLPGQHASRHHGRARRQAPA